MSAARADRPFTVGLTGGLASGKSTVAALLGEAGLTVVDADELIAATYAPGGEGTALVRRLFGEAALHDDGSVDRGAIARRVFTDPEARAALEAEIHPLVRRRFAEVASQAPRGIAVLEATLLVDTGQAGTFDLLVTVEAPEDVRLDRAVARGLSREEARARMAAQTSSEARRKAAHVVIENADSREELERQVSALAHRIRERSARRR